jgi:hypothetical protein
MPPTPRHLKTPVHKNLPDLDCGTAKLSPLASAILAQLTKWYCRNGRRHPHADSRTLQKRFGNQYASGLRELIAKGYISIGDREIRGHRTRQYIIRTAPQPLGITSTVTSPSLARAAAVQEHNLSHFAHPDPVITIASSRQQSLRAGLAIMDACTD